MKHHFEKQIVFVFSKNTCLVLIAEFLIAFFGIKED